MKVRGKLPKTDDCAREAAGFAALFIVGDHGDALIVCTCAKCRSTDAFLASVPGDHEPTR